MATLEVHAYDAQNRLTQTTNPAGEVSSTVYDASGRAQQSVNYLGQTTTYLYDAQGNLIETGYADGTVSRTVYDARGRAQWTQERCAPSGNDTTGPGTETVYDEFGRVKWTRREESVVLRKATFTAVTETQACALNANFRWWSGMNQSTP